MLNETLYKRLQDVFGDVGITNEDSPAELSFKYPPTLSGSIKVQWDIEEGSTGEWYTVRCPFCHDRSKHLNISYLSFSAPSVPGYQTEGKGLIANCFHGCLNNHPERLQQLSNLLQMRGTVYLKIDKSPVQRESYEVSDEVSVSGIRTWCPDYNPIVPGVSAPEIIEKYIQERGWTKEQLAQHLAGYAHITSRKGEQINNGCLMLVFPFVQRGMLKGYQARTPYNKDICDNMGLLRWYTHPGLKKTAVLYNFDNAVKFPFVCVSEGVTDVLSIGPYGVGIMGTTPAKYQKQLLMANWSEGAVIFLPDRKLIHNADGSVTDPVDLAQHQVDEFNKKGCFRHGAYVVKLSGDDPGSMTQEQIWEETCSQTNHLLQSIL